MARDSLGLTPSMMKTVPPGSSIVPARTWRLAAPIAVAAVKLSRIGEMNAAYNGRWAPTGSLVALMARRIRVGRLSSSSSVAPSPSLSTASPGLGKPFALMGFQFCPLSRLVNTPRLGAAT